MATINYTLDTNNDDFRVVTWPAMAVGDIGQPVTLVGYSDRSVQVAGTFGAAGSVTLQGSNDGVNYAPLSNPQGTVLTATAAKIQAVSELTRNFRPTVTAGDGTTSLTITALFRRSV